MAQPGAARVVQVPVEVADPQRVERDAGLRGELAGRVAPGLAVLAGDQQEPPRRDEVLDRAPVAVLILDPGVLQRSARPDAGDGEIQAVVRRVREHALDLLRAQIAAAFGDDSRSPVTDQLARFALAAIDGAFAAWQADREAALGQLLQSLAPSLVAARRALLAEAD